MKFEFAKYTEVTKVAKKVNAEYKEYERVFICPDVHDFWLCRIIKGYDAAYEVDPESYLLERNKVPMNYKGEALTLSRLQEILENDDFSNWDYEQSYKIENLIEIIDGGFGINNLEEAQ